MVDANERARQLVETLETRLAEVRSRAARLPKRPRVFFEEWDDLLISGIGWFRSSSKSPRRNGMSSRSPRRKVSYFEPVPPRLARNIESTFEVGCRFRCTMRVHCGQLYPGARDPAGTRRMVSPYARAPRRRGACGLARWSRCGLSARRTDNRCAPGARRSVKSSYPPYFVRRRFVLTKHKVINCKLGAVHR